MAKLSLDQNTLQFTTALEFKHTINTKNFPQFLHMPESMAQEMLDEMTKHFFAQPITELLEKINANNSGTFVEVVL